MKQWLTLPTMTRVVIMFLKTCSASLDAPLHFSPASASKPLSPLTRILRIPSKINPFLCMKPPSFVPVKQYSKTLPFHPQVREPDASLKKRRKREELYARGGEIRRWQRDSGS